jgi:predicted NodU family carbamoyl transferase
MTQAAQVVLGLSGGREHAAALAVDGRIAAAASQSSVSDRDGSSAAAHPGELPLEAITACLNRAGLKVTNITRIVIADERLWTDDALSPSTGKDEEAADAAGAEMLAALRDVRRERIGAAHAAALEAIASPLSTVDAGAPVIVIDASDSREGVVFERSEGGRLAAGRTIAGIAAALTGARTATRALGLGPVLDLDALHRLGRVGGAAKPIPLTLPSPLSGARVWQDEIAAAFVWTDTDNTIAVDQPRLDRAIDAARQDIPGALDYAASAHLAVQQRRQQLAAAVVDALFLALASLFEAERRRASSRTVVAAGTLFSQTTLNSYLRDALGGNISFSAVPEPAGRAIGAALAPFEARTAPVTLALGPAYTETDLKNTLENCRLDYVYEPDWSRLLTRVTGMLARGRVVAWYQGATDFGPRSSGGRSILCDPSNRYTRDNVNGYLLRRALDHPLPLALTPEAAAECLEPACTAPFTLQEARVRESFADKLKGVLDASRVCPIHIVQRAHAPELVDLLEAYRQRTQVPGLVHLTLASGGGPLAGTPRAAVRTMFSSAIDVLVMGRFLVMKDYWLLRSQVD